MVCVSWQGFQQDGDLVSEAACHYTLGENYLRIARSRHACTAFSACRRLREKLVSEASTGSKERTGELATALCKEGIAAYGSGDLRRSGQALLSLINNYSPSFSHGADQAFEAYITLARIQVT